MPSTQSRTTRPSTASSPSLSPPPLPRSPSSAASALRPVDTSPVKFYNNTSGSAYQRMVVLHKQQQGPSSASPPFAKKKPRGNSSSNNSSSKNNTAKGGASMSPPLSPAAAAAMGKRRSSSLLIDESFSTGLCDDEDTDGAVHNNNNANTNSLQSSHGGQNNTLNNTNNNTNHNKYSNKNSNSNDSNRQYANNNTQNTSSGSNGALSAHDNNNTSNSSRSAPKQAPSKRPYYQRRLSIGEVLLPPSLPAPTDAESRATRPANISTRHGTGAAGRGGGGGSAPDAVVSAVGSGAPMTDGGLSPPHAAHNGTTTATSAAMRVGAARALDAVKSEYSSLFDALRLRAFVRQHSRDTGMDTADIIQMMAEGSSSSSNSSDDAIGSNDKDGAAHRRRKRRHSSSARAARPDTLKEELKRARRRAGVLLPGEEEGGEGESDARRRRRRRKSRREASRRQESRRSGGTNTNGNRSDGDDDDGSLIPPPPTTERRIVLRREDMPPGFASSSDEDKDGGAHGASSTGSSSSSYGSDDYTSSSSSSSSSIDTKSSNKKAGGTSGDNNTINATDDNTNTTAKKQSEERRAKRREQKKKGPRVVIRTEKNERGDITIITRTVGGGDDYDYGGGQQHSSAAGGGGGEEESLSATVDQIQKVMKERVAKRQLRRERRAQRVAAERQRRIMTLLRSTGSGFQELFDGVGDDYSPYDALERYLADCAARKKRRAAEDDASSKIALKGPDGRQLYKDHVNSAYIPPGSTPDDDADDGVANEEKGEKKGEEEGGDGAVPKEAKKKVFYPTVTVPEEVAPQDRIAVPHLGALPTPSLPTDTPSYDTNKHNDEYNQIVKKLDRVSTPRLKVAQLLRETAYNSATLQTMLAEGSEQRLIEETRIRTRGTFGSNEAEMREMLGLKPRKLESAVGGAGGDSLLLANRRRNVNASLGIGGGESGGGGGTAPKNPHALSIAEERRFMGFRTRTIDSTYKDLERRDRKAQRGGIESSSSSASSDCGEEEEEEDGEGGGGDLLTVRSIAGGGDGAISSSRRRLRQANYQHDVIHTFLDDKGAHSIFERASDDPLLQSAGMQAAAEGISMMRAQQQRQLSQAAGSSSSTTPRMPNGKVLPLHPGTPSILIRGGGGGGTAASPSPTAAAAAERSHLNQFLSVPTPSPMGRSHHQKMQQQRKGGRRAPAKEEGADDEDVCDVSEYLDDDGIEQYSEERHRELKDLVFGNSVEELLKRLFVSYKTIRDLRALLMSLQDEHARYVMGEKERYFEFMSSLEKATKARIAAVEAELRTVQEKLARDTKAYMQSIVDAEREVTRLTDANLAMAAASRDKIADLEKRLRDLEASSAAATTAATSAADRHKEVEARLLVRVEELEHDNTKLKTALDASSKDCAYMTEVLQTILSTVALPEQCTVKGVPVASGGASAGGDAAAAVTKKKSAASLLLESASQKASSAASDRGSRENSRVSTGSGGADASISSVPPPTSAPPSASDAYPLLFVPPSKAPLFTNGVAKTLLKSAHTEYRLIRKEFPPLGFANAEVQVDVVDLTGERPAEEQLTIVRDMLTASEQERDKLRSVETILKETVTHSTTLQERLTAQEAEYARLNGVHKRSVQKMIRNVGDILLLKMKIARQGRQMTTQRKYIGELAEENEWLREKLRAAQKKRLKKRPLYQLEDDVAVGGSSSVAAAGGGGGGEVEEYDIADAATQKSLDDGFIAGAYAQSLVNLYEQEYNAQHPPSVAPQYRTIPISVIRHQGSYNLSNNSGMKSNTDIPTAKTIMAKVLRYNVTPTALVSASSSPMQAPLGGGVVAGGGGDGGGGALALSPLQPSLAATTPRLVGASTSSLTEQQTSPPAATFLIPNPTATPNHALNRLLGWDSKGIQCTDVDIQTAMLGADAVTNRNKALRMTELRELNANKKAASVTKALRVLAAGHHNSNSSAPLAANNANDRGKKGAAPTRKGNGSKSGTVSTPRLDDGGGASVGTSPLPLPASYSGGGELQMLLSSVVLGGAAQRRGSSRSTAMGNNTNNNSNNPLGSSMNGAMSADLRFSAETIDSLAHVMGGDLLLPPTHHQQHDAYMATPLSKGVDPFALPSSASAAGSTSAAGFGGGNIPDFKQLAAATAREEAFRAETLLHPQLRAARDAKREQQRRRRESSGLSSGSGGDGDSRAISPTSTSSPLSPSLGAIGGADGGGLAVEERADAALGKILGKSKQKEVYGDDGTAGTAHHHDHQQHRPSSASAYVRKVRAGSAMARLPMPHHGLGTQQGGGSGGGLPTRPHSAATGLLEVKGLPPPLHALEAIVSAAAPTQYKTMNTKAALLEATAHAWEDSVLVRAQRGGGGKKKERDFYDSHPLVVDEGDDDADAVGGRSGASGGERDAKDATAMLLADVSPSRSHSKRVGAAHRSGGGGARQQHQQHHPTNRSSSAGGGGAVGGYYQQHSELPSYEREALERRYKFDLSGSTNNSTAAMGGRSATAAAASSAAGWGDDGGGVSFASANASMIPSSSSDQQPPRPMRASSSASNTRPSSAAATGVGVGGSASFSSSFVLPVSRGALKMFTASSASSQRPATPSREKAPMGAWRNRKQ